jgi:trk system potassium uptake protein TrkH
VSPDTKTHHRIVRRSLTSRRETVTGHLVGLLLAAAGAGMGVCGLVETLDGGDAALSLLGPAAGVGLPGLFIWRWTQAPRRISPATIYGAVLAAWLAFCVAASLPYLLSGVLPSLDLALFESVSGFTTTAASVIRPDGVARGVLLWRAMTQWFGGVAIMTFVVSVLPYFRTAGFEHLAGISGGWGGERIAPRVQETARRLVLLYVAFTAFVAAFYSLFGMGPFDAMAHSFTTVSTGGFSTHDASLAHFDSAGVEWTAIVGMVLAGGNFALYWQALRGKAFSLLRSVEMRAYLLIVSLIGVAAIAWQAPATGWTSDGVRRTLFSAVSISTTTGYTSLDYDRWAGAVQLLLVFAMAVGGMAGGSAGGFKVFRGVAVVGHVRRHLFRQLHPRAVPIVRIGDEVIEEAEIGRILGFFGLFMGVGAVATFLVAALGGLDLRTSISAVTSSLGNVGPALGALGPTHTYLDVSTGVREVLMVTMLAGRLELYPVLLGLVPLARFIADRLPRRVAQILVRYGRG